MGCCNTFLRVVSGIFVAYFTIIGIALAAYGAFSTFTLSVINTERVLNDYLTLIPSLITFVVGLLLLIIVILGCCAICRQTPCCLNTYSVLLLVLALFQLGLGAYCLITYSQPEFTHKLRNQVTNDITNAVDFYTTDPTFMDRVQNWLGCCGAENAQIDYEMKDQELPSSCCQDAIFCNKYSPNRYTDGCIEQVYVYTIGTNYFIGWVSLIVAITEIIAAVLGTSLSCYIWKHQSASW